MRQVMCVLLLVLGVALWSAQETEARPSRIKRVSDQRLAEIETLLALSKFRGMLSTVPVGYGKIDYQKLGRRRRAANLLWRELLDDSSDLTDDSEELIDPKGAQLNYRRAGLDWQGDSPQI